MGRIEELTAEMMNGLYGPKYCEHCEKVQPVETYVLQGSEYDKLESMVYTKGFTGAHVCRVCHRTVGLARLREARHE